jgi:hypothetical protein
MMTMVVVLDISTIGKRAHMCLCMFATNFKMIAMNGISHVICLVQKKVKAKEQKPPVVFRYLYIRV